MDLDPKKRPLARDIVDMLDKTDRSGGYSEETATSSSSHSVMTWSTKWWGRLNSPACSDAEFRRAFRMSRRTFDALCDELSAVVACRGDNAAAIPVQQRVAVCLWHLATGEPFREVSSRMSTCRSIVLQVCAALATALLPEAVRWPLEFQVVSSRFQALSGIPGVVGAVCTDRIPIRPPKEHASEYLHRLSDSEGRGNNKASSYSVAVQAVVDANGLFMDISIGLPGSLSDADVLERSVLHANCVAGLLGNDQYRLLGGESYPLRD
jgi:hypothetical protein